MIDGLLFFGQRLPERNVQKQLIVYDDVDPKILIAQSLKVEKGKKKLTTLRLCRR